MSAHASPTTAEENATAAPAAEKTEETAAEKTEETAAEKTEETAAEKTEETAAEKTEESDTAEPPPPPPSAMKGKSGRERSADRKLRFDPNVQVVETPSFALVMNTDEGEDEEEEIAIFDRLYDEAHRRAERMKKLEEVEEGEEAKGDLECTFKPVISESAKALGKYASWSEFLHSQEERKKTFLMHFTKKKDKVISDERAPLFEDMPRKHSLRIISYLEKERNYRGPIKGWRARFRKYMSRLCEQDPDSSANIPRHSDALSVHSGILRDDAVFDRLYEEAHVRTATQRVLFLTQLEKESREFFHPVTNRTDFSVSERRAALECGESASNFSLTARSCGSTVFDELYAASEVYQRRREARAAAAAERREEFTFRPATNPRSGRIIVERAIARAKGQIPRQRQRRRKEEEEAARAASHSPRPRFQADIFCSRLQRREIERAERLAAMRRETRMEEVAECTFRPSISRRSVAIAEEKGYGRVAFAKKSPKEIRTAAFQAARINARGEERGGREEEEEEYEEDEEEGEEEVGHANARQGGEIDALASELRGVLSAWTEVAEEAQGAF